MKNETIHNILSSEEIEDLLNNSDVKTNKEKLSDTQTSINFSIDLPDNIKTILENNFKIDLSAIAEIPMRWIRGDTFPHIDTGITQFDNTYLIYLTDSIGNLIINGVQFPIVAGDAHIFSEGLEHSTINTGNNDRLMIGPMSELGFSVGALRIYYRSSSIKDLDVNSYDSQYGTGFYYEKIIYNTNYITILNIPPPIPTDNVDTIYYWNNTGDSDSIAWAPPSGKIFGGWKLMDIDYNSPFDNNTVDKIYMPGETYSYSNTIWLVPNWIDIPGYIPSLHINRPKFTMHFTDNSLVFYKPNSLSTGGGGSGVRNSRYKQRRT